MASRFDTSGIDLRIVNGDGAQWIQKKQGVKTMNNSVELNAEGLKKLSDYRDDLIASGKNKPQPVTQESTIRYIEMPVNCQSNTAVNALKKRNLVGFTLAKIRG